MFWYKKDIWCTAMCGHIKDIYPASNLHLELLYYISKFWVQKMWFNKQEKRFFWDIQKAEQLLVTGTLCWNIFNFRASVYAFSYKLGLFLDIIAWVGACVIFLIHKTFLFVIYLKCSYFYSTPESKCSRTYPMHLKIALLSMFQNM